MEDIIKQYGVGFLEMISGVGVCALYKLMMQPGGAWYEMIQAYLSQIC